MTWQPEAAGAWPDDPDRADGPGLAGDPGPRPGRAGRGRAVLFGLLLTAALFGLALSAFGIAHQLLPRQFTPAQQRAIASWQLKRRWRALPASRIFPEVVRYWVSDGTLDSATGLDLDARRLGIASRTACSDGVTRRTAAVLARYGCAAVLRASYVDSSGSLVATVAVAVLPDTTAARLAGRALAGPPGASPEDVRPFRVARTAAARFGLAQRQLSSTTWKGPYVVISTVGFADGRRQVLIAVDGYLDGEMFSLARGLTVSAASEVGRTPPTPACPGTPGC